MSDFKERNEHFARAMIDVQVSYIEAERAACDLEAENRKLRELCRRYGEYISQDRCEECVYKMRCNNGFIDECWQRSEIRDLARELGVEAE